jgi:hypothetical protein
VVDLARTPLATLVTDEITAETNKMLLDLQVQLQAGAISDAEHNAAVANVNSYKTDMAINVNRRGKCPILARFNYDGYPASGGLAGSVIGPDVVWDSSIGDGQNLIPVTLTPPAGRAAVNITEIMFSFHALTTSPITQTLCCHVLCSKCWH